MLLMCLYVGAGVWAICLDGLSMLCTVTNLFVRRAWLLLCEAALDLVLWSAMMPV